MSPASPISRRTLALLATAALTVGVTAAVAPPAVAAVPATISPVVQPTAQTVTSTPLPTTQIDGVAWSQAVLGNTVYVGGKFTNARPAGAAAGTSLTPRANILAYNITDGTLVNSFAPDANAQVRAVAATPDGSRFFVGGDFTTIGGQGHARIAEFTADGKIVGTFRASVNTPIKAIVATNTTVYVGGMFTVANGNPVNRLAAFDIGTGNLLNWTPDADSNAGALALTPDGSKVIAGGNFGTINGTTVPGLAALDATTGAVLPWAANKTVGAWGPSAAITSLTTDGNAIYGTAYNYAGNGNLEGTFSADPSTGTINWIEDCHGDTYDTFPVNGIVYSVSHAHFCANIGGYPDASPNYVQRTLAFTAAATGTIAPNSQPGYWELAGNPSPSIVNWMPTVQNGTFTGQYQAAWSVKGNANYVVEGGEFPTVNGIAQQGLVRFAVPSISPDKTPPTYAYGGYQVSVTPVSTTSARITIPANWDRDSTTLTYTVGRTANGGKPVYTGSANSTYWNRPSIGFLDTNLTPGQDYWYSLKATDAAGNTSYGTTVKITMPTTNPSNAYAQAVQNSGANAYWRLDNASGTTVSDWSGNTLLTSTGLGLGAEGAINGDADTAVTLPGKAGSYAQPAGASAGPATFSVEAWFKTTSASSSIVGFGNTSLPLQSPYLDRTLYLDNAGRAAFMVKPNNATKTVYSQRSYNDGQWHQAVATVSSAGITLYVDGAQVAANSSIPGARTTPAGFWHIGGDSLNGVPNASANTFLNGSIDDVSVYPTVLSAATVAAHYASSGR